MTDSIFDPDGALSGRYLRDRGYCCQNGCKNCPYGFRKPPCRPLLPSAIYDCLTLASVSEVQESTLMEPSGENWNPSDDPETRTYGSATEEVGYGMTHAGNEPSNGQPGKPPG